MFRPAEPLLCLTRLELAWRSKIAPAAVTHQLVDSFVGSLQLPTTEEQLQLLVHACPALQELALDTGTWEAPVGIGLFSQRFLQDSQARITLPGRSQCCTYCLCRA